MENREKLSILVIDSDPAVSKALRDLVNNSGLRLCNRAEPDSSIEMMDTFKPDIVIMGPSFDIDRLFRCIQKIKILNPVMPILACCNDSGVMEELRDSTFEGIHYLSQSPDSDDILRMIDCSLEFKTECELLPEVPIIIGRSPGVKEIRKKIKKIADKDITVLITGETGTGKELIAHSIHYHSFRNKGPLVTINCGSLPDELLESEVFGFQKGAFTDAYKNKPGRIELAHEGTLFIDEIGDLSLGLQVKFLQVLEDKVFSRLGAVEDIIIDTRVVVATNSDLLKKVQEGTFRKDLFYRLNVIHIKALPLRYRKKDLPLLIHYFLNKYCFEFKKELPGVPDKIMDAFMTYHWPGNVRELENVVRRAIIVKDWAFIFKELNFDDTLPDEDYDEFSFSYAPHSHSDWDRQKLEKYFNEEDFSLKKISKAYVSDAERGAVLNALKATDWNRKKTAQLLQVSYKTLLNRINEFELKP